MAYFHEMDLSKGWWFYFELRVAAKDKEFTDAFISDIERVFLMKGSDDVIDKNGKKQERVPMQRL